MTAQPFAEAFEQPLRPALQVDDSFAADQLKLALRQLAGGVSIITAGEGADRSGATVTSATALSVEPPRMLVLLNRTASTWPVIERHGHFGVNILGAEHEALAHRFAGRDGVKGAARYEGARWQVLKSGAPLLQDALAAIDCVVEEALERHSHIIVIGRVLAIQSRDGASLAYRDGRYIPV